MLRRSLALIFLLTSAHCYSESDSAESSSPDIADPAIDLESKPDDGGSCDPDEPVDTYQACYGDSARCVQLNSSCSGYTANKATSFCAQLCESDEECPTLSGFSAACNFAWCAVLCDDSECPDGMECVQEIDFIDRNGKSRGPRDVCVRKP